MVVAAPNTAKPAEKRLTIATGEIAENTTTIRSLDWDRDRFDIEFGLQNGTTYNSYIVRGEKTALIDTSHAKFQQLYMDALTGLIDPKEIDYIVISHTEPDHSGLVKDVLDLAPQAVVVGAKVAVKFLEDLVHQPFESQLVKSGDTLDLGNGHVLEFVSAPNLHWPDTIFTYDQKTGILYTCDAFGAHYCSDDTFDEDLDALTPDFRFYYECLMAPNARSVLSAMKRMDKLGTISTIATGHGPLLRHNLEELTERYRRWSNEKSKAENMVAVFYVSDYGYCDRISQALAKGITKTGVAVEMMDMRLADPHDVTELVGRAKGILMGMPPSSGQGAEEVQTALSSILAAVNNKQTYGLFESYGGDDEPIDTLQSQLQDLDLKVAFDPIRVKDTPSEALYQLCDETGTDLGQDLAQAKKIKKIKGLDADLQKALGRISSGLYIITAAKGAVTSAMLASWISQASFKPLGFTIAVAKDRAIESLMQVGDTFVLNILEEGNHLPLMKHFLKRFPPGADRFAGIRTRPANNKSPILADALAYLECTVTTRMELSDHWLVYCTVADGKVSKDESMTAVHHRKIGNYY
ncbi:MBL fold metallo-hydrolase [Leptolyngbyaceae cyanobacterium CCMR0082]|uniref:MBL fold metallo-hydrolase n=2 Tax=Adonisia turfae TaxID=2950184 RepID=A0A6M0S598_9CYAN|nr:diflavin flavoprotein [Adonisia turfae]MDV3353789.1 diflavin flavoprotein [Leptothoe sp. LEGE 181152]NEZ58811.1 MBL fold metallo-hydrolase [Adonisia turfae CCMR0081]NEZ63520.1 MBL fold metallo-hydrolase [Adonisia turfae CCMR0082]